MSVLDKAKVEAFLASASEEDLEVFRVYRNRLVDELSGLNERMSARWSLSLAVGNGAGLVSIGSKLVGSAVDTWTYLFLPTAIMFAIGLLFVGVSHAIAMWRTHINLEISNAQNLALSTSDLDVWRDQDPKRKKFWWAAETVTETVSGVLFVAGLLYPLAVLWLRLVTKGTLAP